MRRCSIVTRDDPEALELIRHDCAHVLAEAVQELFPGTQVTIGPVIENGFYYDFFRNEPFTPEDFAAIEKKMREIIQRDKPFTKTTKTREEAKDFFRAKGEMFKVELVDAIPAGPGHQVLRPGRLDRSVPRPAHDVDRQDRQRLQADEGGRRLLARRFQEPDADAHLRHRLGQREGARGLSPRAGGGREARPPQARPRDGPVPFPGGGAGRRLLARQGLDHVPAADRLHAPPARQARLPGGERAAAARQVAVGNVRPLGLVQGGHVRRHVGGRDDRGRPGLRHQADELPRPRADLQARAAVLPRTAAAAGRIRQCPPLRAVGRAARPDARARLHAGRRAHLLHRRPDGGRVPEDQRSDPLDLQGLRLRGDRGEALDAARKARRLGRGLGPRRETS